MLPPGSPPQRLAPTTEPRTRGRLPGSRESGGPRPELSWTPWTSQKGHWAETWPGVVAPSEQGVEGEAAHRHLPEEGRGTPGPASPQAWGAVGSGSGEAGPLPAGLGWAGGTLRPLPKCANLLEARVGRGERGQRRSLSRAWRSLPARP